MRADVPDAVNNTAIGTYVLVRLPDATEAVVRAIVRSMDQTSAQRAERNRAGTEVHAAGL
jgi:hypothetical protein